jgi:UDP-2,3-diacylglucosamine pyrophosphatase LpxH
LGIVDIRAFHWFDLKVDNPLVKQFAKELFGRIRSESEKRTKKREETLFGIKKPDRMLIEFQKLSDS